MIKQKNVKKEKERKNFGWLLNIWRLPADPTLTLYFFIIINCNLVNVSIHTSWFFEAIIIQQLHRIDKLWLFFVPYHLFTCEYFNFHQKFVQKICTVFQMSQLNRYKGCLVGGLIGDCFGAAYEFLPRSSSRESESRMKSIISG